MQLQRQDITGTPVAVNVETDLHEHLRLTHNEHDGYLANLAMAAEDIITDMTGVQLRQYETTLFTSWKREIDLPFPPVVNVVSVHYMDANHEWHPMPYSVKETGARSTVVMETLPNDAATRGDNIKIIYVNGYTNITDTRLKMAVTFLVSHWFYNVTPLSEARYSNLPYTFRTLIKTIKALNVYASN